MTTKDNGINGSRWSHQNKPSKDLAVMTLLISIVSFIVVLFLRTDAEAVIDTTLLVTLVTLSVFLVQTKTTTIEIDRDKGTVNKMAKYLMFTMRKSYPLQEFDGVKLLEKDDPAEEGYRIRRFSVVLSGRNRSLELFSADSETEGKAFQKELAGFLKLSA